MELAIVDTTIKMNLVHDNRPSDNCKYFCFIIWHICELILSLLKGCFWVDASDKGREPGQFFWRNGVRVDDALWKTMYPKTFGAGKEACVVLQRKALIDWDCNGSGHYILCEVPEEHRKCF
jgi:hypothetical protein